MLFFRGYEIWKAKPRSELLEECILQKNPDIAQGGHLVSVSKGRGGPVQVYLQSEHIDIISPKQFSCVIVTI